MPVGTISAGRAALRWQMILIALVSLVAGLGSLVPLSQTALAASQGASSISAGFGLSCATQSGKAYCWGDDEYGALGDGGSTDSSVPVAADTIGALAGKTLTQISANTEACALDSLGAAYCWGFNSDGQLGDGATANSSVPVAVDTSDVLAGKTLTQITAGNGAACALDSTGRAYCWGYELGDGSTASSSVPVAVDTSGVLAGKTLTQISTSGLHTCALDSTGKAYCWGRGDFGDLGDGGSTDSTVPVAVNTTGALSGKTLTQITTGEIDTCAIDSVGAAYCWGHNDYGDLGDGSSNSSNVPVAVDATGVLSGKSLTQIAAGYYATCALDSAGAAYCWGLGTDGELGDGTVNDSSVPVAVDTTGPLAGKVLTQISAGVVQTCAVDSAGAVYCWGSGYEGDLGDGSSTNSSVPVRVAPQAPTRATAVPGDAAASVSWRAPTWLNTGTITGYTATATPGGAACSTASTTTCTINGLTNGTAYSITVVAQTTVGDSGASTPAGVIPGNEIAFTSAPDDTVAIGAPFSFTVTATGSPSPTITKAGRLPSGVRFTGGKHGIAMISGTPAKAAAGVYQLTLTARNKNGTATQSFTLTVTRPPALAKIRTIRIREGAALHRIIQAMGYPAPVLAESGPLPHGLTFTDNGNETAVIAGTPAAGSRGCYRIATTATNASGTATQHFKIIVRQRRR